jgi:hypothetical protein
MVDYEAVRLAIRRRMLEAEDTVLPPPERCQWENEMFTPPGPLLDPADPGKSLWVRETLLPDDEPRRAFGLTEATGLYQLDVYYPVGAGTREPEALAKGVRDLFEPGGPFVGTDDARTVVHVDRCRRVNGNDGNVQPVWYVVSVLIQWRAYAEVQTF